MINDWTILFYTALLLGLCTSTVVDLENVAETERGTYTTSLKRCSLKLGDKNFFSSEKGERGDTGPKGDKGERGRTTECRGPMGEKGDRGFNGLQGGKGPKGKPGPPGRPGLPGSCPCTQRCDTSTARDDNSTSAERGSMENPALDVCKKLTLKESTRDVIMGVGKMRVNCELVEKDTKEMWTCLPSIKKVYVKSEIKELEPFWLSSKGITIKDIYNVTQSQLAWIQEKSIKAYQEITYHCKNSAPYDPALENQSLLMMSFNDAVFGPKPQESSPFVYDLPSETNDCLKPGSESRTSLIKIESVASRLPVIDFLIRDLRDLPSDFSIQHTKLCFF